MAEGGGNAKWWVSGILGPVIVGLVIWGLTHSGGPLNPNPATTTTRTTPASEFGTIEGVALTTTSPCCNYTVRTTISGLIGQDCTLGYLLTNNTRGVAYREVAAVSLTPQATSDTANSSVSVPVSVPGQYSVVFVLRGPNGTELARSATQPLRVT